MNEPKREWTFSLRDDVFEDENGETMVDLGGGMVVPLRELMEDD
jgi:hypothetical protein